MITREQEYTKKLLKIFHTKDEDAIGSMMLSIDAYLRVPNRGDAEEHSSLIVDLLLNLHELFYSRYAAKPRLIPSQNKRNGNIFSLEAYRAAGRRKKGGQP
jgi:hypothetical protein